LARIANNHCVRGEGTVVVDALDHTITQVTVVEVRTLRVGLTSTSSDGLTDADAVCAHVIFGTAIAIIAGIGGVLVCTAGL